LRDNVALVGLQLCWFDGWSADKIMHMPDQRLQHSTHRQYCIATYMLPTQRVLCCHAGATSCTSSRLLLQAKSRA
jgi:hypothetical protein